MLGIVVLEGFWVAQQLLEILISSVVALFFLRN